MGHKRVTVDNFSFISHYVHIKRRMAGDELADSGCLYIPLRSYKTRVEKLKRLFPGGFISHYVHIKRWIRTGFLKTSKFFISHYVHIKRGLMIYGMAQATAFISHYVHIKPIIWPLSSRTTLPFISHYVHIKLSSSSASSVVTSNLYIPLRSYKTLSTFLQQ